MVGDILGFFFSVNLYVFLQTIILPVTVFLFGSYMHEPRHILIASKLTTLYPWPSDLGWPILSWPFTNTSCFPSLTTGLSNEWTIVIKYNITFEGKRDCIMWKLDCLVHACISFRRNYSLWEAFHSVWCSPYILPYAIYMFWYIAEFTKAKASELRRSVTGGREVDMPCYMTVMSLPILLYNWCPSRDQCPLAPRCLTAVTRNAKLQP